ncbi:toll/interleukin-1 receptor domain-containing protein [Mesorhizobium opportunistum]|uniref:Toll/interleukin-1 receptor domain-containing protein n=1 Tax=Mesorhizobium opportunistum TaxID=593909 RepID=A0ABV1YA72_9HYPH
MTDTRDAVFISHATPEDNAFTLWLGGRLTALGYHVFADVMRLKGGDDWERILEDAIRNKARRFLLVATPGSVQKQGVRNEINIANETGKRIKEPGFIVPLRLAAYQSPLQIVQAQYIDFEKGWAQGLAELLPVLEDAGVPRNATPSAAQAWQNLQLKDARTLGAGPETLISNWLSIEALPPSIGFYDFKGGISIGAAQTMIKDCRIPIAAHNRGFISFAPLHQLQDYFGPNLPLQLVDTCETDTFLESGWHSQRLAPKDCRPKFTDISRRALDAYFEDKGLKPFEYADGRNAWWPSSGKATMDQHPFAWAGLKGRRQLVGRSEKRGFHWHYGVSCWARSGPVRHVRMYGRVIFTSNGHDLIGDARRIHRMRRTFCKGWRNDKWRDLLLAFWYWLAGGADFVDVALGEGVFMRLSLPPITFAAPFGVNSPSDSASEDQDDDDELIVDRDDDDFGDDDDGEV